MTKLNMFAKTLTTLVVAGILLNTKAVNAECVDVGTGLAYNTTTREVAPLINGSCKVIKNIFVEPFVKFNKTNTTYGMGLNYRFVNRTPVTPSVGIGLETGDGTRGYGKFGLGYQTAYPVLLDVNLKIPFENKYPTELGLGARYQF